MQKRSLRQRRQCLVKAVDHDIRSPRISVLRKIWMKAKMRSMGFIHNQWYAFFMDRFCYGFHIRYHAVISGRHDDHCPDGRILIKGLPHIVYGNLCIQLRAMIEFRIQIHWIQFIHVYGMIHRLVAISCHKYGISFFSYACNGA